MTYKTCKTDKTYPIPEDVNSSKEWGCTFSRESGFSILIHKKYWMSIFMHKELTSSSCKKLLSTEGVIAHCISCVGEDWEVRAEPTGESKAGFIVYTAKGKPIGCGEIDIDEKGIITFSSQALYPGITNAISIDYTIEGKGTDTGWEVSGSVTVTDSRF